MLPYFKENIRGYFGDMNDEADSMSDWKSLKIWVSSHVKIQCMQLIVCVVLSLSVYRDTFLFVLGVLT